ncbi:MAG: hypothetical protein PVF58_18190 [Candidatus Methanofastidiosia archaeon]
MKEHHLEIIYDYVRYCTKTKDVRHLRFHNAYNPYKKKQSTFKLINRAISQQIIFPPRLFCIQKAKVKLLDHKDHLQVEQFEKEKKLQNTYYVVLLLGSHSLLSFSVSDSQSDTNLSFARCTFPTYPSEKKISDIDPCCHGAGKLPVMEPPDWSPFEWKVYYERNNPVASSVKIGEKLKVSYRTVLNAYYRIVEDCTIWIPFFPLGYENYVQYLVSLQTDYEIGLIEELKKIDRSSYIYKIDDTILLNLFFKRQIEIDSILKLEKKGEIRNLRVSSPLWSYEHFQP